MTYQGGTTSRLGMLELAELTMIFALVVSLLRLRRRHPDGRARE